MSNHDQEMDLAMSRIGVLRFRLDEAEAKLTDLKSTADRFKAEVEHLTSENKLVREESDRHYQMWVDSQAELEEARRGSGAGMKAMLGLSDDLVAENARLKADVNELADGLKLASEVGIKIADEVTRLKAEVERLRKAGDGMEEVIWLNGCLSGMQIKERAVKVWNAAKEGKQS